MITYIKVFINKTSKGFGSKEGYCTFDNETKTFATIKEAKDWLKETYGSVKRVKMYQDRKDGTTYQAGWIYCFKNKDWSHNSESWLQQDWVEITDVKETIINF